MDDRINKYFTPLKVDYDREKLDEAVGIVYQKFNELLGDRRLRPLSISKALDALPSSTAAGLPFQPGVKKGMVRNQLIRIAKSQWNRVCNGKTIKVAPCIAGTRRSLRAKGENKPRLVWAYPGYINVIESQFAKPFTELCPASIAWSLNWFDYGLSYDRIQRQMRNGRAIMNLDFSSFDSTVGAYLIRKCFGIFRKLFELSDDEEFMLDNLIDYFIHTPLIMAKSVYQSHRGIPSGSAFTQLIGSLANMVSCVYADLRFNSQMLDIDASIWLGDDSFLVFPSSVNDEDMLSDWLKPFAELGLVVNSEKTLITRRNRQVHKFLGREFVRGKLEMKVDLEKLKAQVILPEFKDKVPADVLQRLSGLAWIYGINEDAYRLLLYYYTYILKNFTTEEKPTRVDVRFLTQFGLSEKMIKQFPKLKEVRSRQTGIDVPLFIQTYVN